jgi:hypothetical protein
MQSGDLHPVKIGRRTLFAQSELDRIARGFHRDTAASTDSNTPAAFEGEAR